MRLPYPQWTNYECQRKYGGGYGGWLSYYHYPNGGYYGNHHHKSFGSKMAVTSSGNASMPNNMPRIHRKAIRTASKRFPGKSMPGKLHTVTRLGPGKIMKNTGKRISQRPNPPICDNSNDSGLGFDNQELCNAAAYHAQMGHRTNGTSLSTNRQQQQQQQQQQQHQLTAITGPSSLSPSLMGHQPGTSSSLCASTPVITQNVEEAMKRRRAGGPDSQSSAMTTQLQMDTDDACSSDAFVYAQQQRMQQLQQQSPIGGGGGGGGVTEMLSMAAASTITTSSPGKLGSGGAKSTARRQTGAGQVMQLQGGAGLSKNGRQQLQILAQPEQQHRARYQTEGSRGAVKDRSGNSFPIVRLLGYDKPAVLEVFIGTDVGRVAPHMFYQACKVSGKNSTPCIEKKVEGTMIIELDLRPDQEMMVTCDCVGILKERNVDVEHRFPDQSSQRSKKKSTRCRMVFRATITNDDGSTEVLQVCSQPIICTQPPGVPEICKKSLISCPVMGGFELFIIGKNFAKDTKIVFQQQKLTGELLWQEVVVPDKEYLQQTHLICTIPAYIEKHRPEPVTVQLYAMANGRKSEYHNFVYTPKDGPYSSAMPSYSIQSHVAEDLQCLDLKSTDDMMNQQMQQQQQQQQQLDQWTTTTSSQESTDCGMMPPPHSTLSMSLRRSSSGGILNGVLTADQLSPSSGSSCSSSPGNSSCSSSSNSNCSLKVEVNDESSQSSLGEMPVPLMMTTDALSLVPAATVKQEEFDVAQHNLLMNMTSQVVAAAAAAAASVAPSPVVVAPPPPIQFTDQQLTTISQAINATTTNPATSSVCDVGGGTLHMDTSSQGGGGGGVGGQNLMAASDIILNSSCSIAAVGLGVDVSSATSSPNVVVLPLDHHSSLSPEVILNPAVTPSLLCDAAALPPVSTVVSVNTAARPSMVVVDQSMLAAASNSVVDSNGVGLLVDPMTATTAAALQSPQSPNGGNGLATTAEVVQNVQNMILNAAAEILVSQQTTISNESMQAIISLNNAASMLNDQQQVEPVVTGGLFTGASPVVVASVGAEDPGLAMMVRRNSNILTETVTSQLGATGSGDIHMRTVHDEIGHMAGGSVPMNELLLTNQGNGTTVSQPLAVMPADVAVQQQQGIVTSVGGIAENGGVVVPTTSNALMAVLSAPMLVNGGVATNVGGEMKVESHPGQQLQQQQPQQPPASIPQEFASMTEHDLISYINPNCFEQEFQNM